MCTASRRNSRTLPEVPVVARLRGLPVVVVGCGCGGWCGLRSGTEMCAFVGVLGDEVCGLRRNGWMCSRCLRNGTETAGFAGELADADCKVGRRGWGCSRRLRSGTETVWFAGGMVGGNCETGRRYISGTIGERGMRGSVAARIHGISSLRIVDNGTVRTQGPVRLVRRCRNA